MEMGEESERKRERRERQIDGAERERVEMGGRE